MLRRMIIPFFFLLPPGLVMAEEAEASVSAVLFEHILDGTSLTLLPFTPPVSLPFGMTVHFLMILLTVLLVCGSFLLSFWKPALKPKGLAMALEMLVLYVRDGIVFPIMGEKRGERWLPFFTSLFVFILVLNVLGLFPAFKSATGNLAVTTALALITLVLVFVIGIIKLGLWQFFKNFYPKGSPLPIGLFVATLEFLGILTKSIVLSLRLFANMFAGHLAILSFLVLMFVLSPFFSAVSLPFAVFTYLLEVLVSLIQALVFTLLSCIFIKMASTSHGDSHA